MEYSIFADLLAKFQNASAPIQALWLVLTAIVALSAIVSLTIILRLLLKRGSRPLPVPDSEPEPEPEPYLLGEILYGVVLAPDGRWLLYVDGKVKEVEEDDRAWIEARTRGAEGEKNGGGGVH